MVTILLLRVETMNHLNVHKYYTDKPIGYHDTFKILSGIIYSNM